MSDAAFTSEEIGEGGDEAWVDTGIGVIFDEEDLERILEAASARYESPESLIRDGVLEFVADVLGDEEGHLECWVEGCEETFTRERKRRGHVGRVHSDNLPEGDFWCGICGYGPTTYTGVGAHHGQRHTDFDVRPLGYEPAPDELLAPDDVPDHMDPELLARLYEQCDGNYTEMCRQHDFEVTAGRVRHYLIEFGIHEPTPQGPRDASEGKPWRDPDWLQERYDAAGGNVSEMHRDLDVDVPYRTLLKNLVSFEIHDPTDPPGRSHGKGGPKPDINEGESVEGVQDEAPTEQAALAEAEEPADPEDGESDASANEPDPEPSTRIGLSGLDHTDRRDLQRAYDAAGGVMTVAAEAFDVSYPTVRSWLIDEGIHEVEAYNAPGPRNALGAETDETEETEQSSTVNAEISADRGEDLGLEGDDRAEEVDDRPEVDPHQELGVDDPEDVESFHDLDTPDWLDEGSFYAAVDMADDVDELRTILEWGSVGVLESMVELLDVDVAISGGEGR